MAQLGIILLYIIGMALVVTELFLPGAIMGLAGLVCMIASIYVAFHKEMAGLGWTFVGISVASIPILIIVWVKVLNRVLAIKQTQEGYTSAQVEFKTLVGSEGVATTQLRPSGMARFGDRKIDVVSEGEVIERDSRIKIIEVESNRVVVRRVKG